MIWRGSSMSVRPSGLPTSSWLSSDCPATRARRYTTTSRHFKVGRELSNWSQKSGDITLVTACGDVVIVVHLLQRPSFLRHVMYSVDYFHRSLFLLYACLSSHILSTTSRVCLESFTNVQQLCE